MSVELKEFILTPWFTLTTHLRFTKNATSSNFAKLFNFHGSVHCNNILKYISNNMQSYTVYFIWKLLYMFRVVPSPIIRNANNCIYSIWYLSHSYCYLPLSWKSWNWFECAVGGVRHCVTITRCCRYSCLRS